MIAMKRNLLFLFFSFFISCFAFSQAVTGIYTDYQGYWASSSTAINPTQPDRSHNLLGFTYSGTTYSTGVNDAILTANDVTFTSDGFRGLPILGLPTSGSGSYFVGLGQLEDGIDNGIDPSPSSPFKAITTEAEVAHFLTDGENGLNMGSCITNIETSQNARFNLSANGIIQSNINDGVVDILVSQVADPTSTTPDKLRFIDGDGNIIGDEISIIISQTASYPVVGNWKPDFYEFNSTQPKTNFINTERPIRFFAAEISDFGIDYTNYQDVVALVYELSGTSDPAFIAYNEPSMGVANQLIIDSQPNTTLCNGNLDGDFSVRIADFAGATVAQGSFPITASIKSGAGILLGTTTVNTDATGEAIFDDLEFEVGGDHTIIFESSSLKPVISNVITAASSCGAVTWTGNINNDWSNPSNWSTGVVPNANYDITIPQGLTNYPVLDVNTGAKNITLETGATINLNGFIFVIEEDATIATGGTSYFDGTTSGSKLYFSGNAPQSIPAGSINGKLANLTIENSNGVTLNTDLSIAEVLEVKEGDFNTNNRLTLACDFTQAGTAQVDEITGTISGNMTIEQCFPARRAFRLVASPVTTTTSIRANWQENPTSYLDNPTSPLPYGTHITGLGDNPTTQDDGTNGFDYNTSGKPSLFTFNNSNTSWNAIDNTDTNLLIAGEPYRLFVRGDRSINILSNATTPTNTKIRATGIIKTGNLDLTGFNSTAQTPNFFGNPYPAAVNMRSVFNDENTSNTTRFYYVYDPTLGGNPTVGDPGGRGAFVTIDLDDLSSDSAGSEANEYLQPMQAAFFVTGSEGTTPNLHFKESFKAVNVSQTQVFRPSTSSPLSYKKQIQVKLLTQDAFNTGASPSDGFKINFSSLYDNAVDERDAQKFSNLDENIARFENGVHLAIEKRGVPTAGETLPIFINQYRYENYVLQLDLTGSFDHKVYLEDTYLQTSTLLSEGNNTYAFSIDTDIQNSLNTDRFSLKIGESNLETTYVSNENFSVYPNPLNGEELYVRFSTTHSTLYKTQLFDVLGQQVYLHNIQSNAQGIIKMNNLQINSGVYVLKLTNLSTGKSYTHKIIKD